MLSTPRQVEWALVTYTDWWQPTTASVYQIGNRRDRFAVDGIRYRPRAEDRRFEDYDTVLIAAASELGIALLRLPLAQSWLDTRRLVVVHRRRLANPAAHHVATAINEDRSSVIELARRIFDMA